MWCSRFRADVDVLLYYYTYYIITIIHYTYYILLLYTILFSSSDLSPLLLLFLSSVPPHIHLLFSSLPSISSPLLPSLPIFLLSFILYVSVLGSTYLYSSILLIYSFPFSSFQSIFLSSPFSIYSPSPPNHSSPFFPFLYNHLIHSIPVES